MAYSEETELTPVEECGRKDQFLIRLIRPYGKPVNHLSSGQGSHGLVVEATVIDKRKINVDKVAIKFCKLSGNSMFRIANELGIQQACYHENILTVLDCYSPDGWLTDICLVFPYIKHPLYSIIENRIQKNDGADLIGWIIYQLMCALEYIHQDGMRIIHGDVKAKNILIDDHPDYPFKYLLKLADFGSALPMGKKVVMPFTGIMPPRPYCAPELLLKQNYDEKVDIWAAGCALALMMRKVHFFRHNTDEELLESILKRIGGPEIGHPYWKLEPLLKFDRTKIKNRVDEYYSSEKLPAWELQKVTPDDLKKILKAFLTFDPAQRKSASNVLDWPMWEYLRKTSNISRKKTVTFNPNSIELNYKIIKESHENAVTAQKTITEIT